MVEHSAVNRGVVGSSPTGAAIYLTNSIGQSSGLLNRRFGVQVPGGVPLIRIETGQVLSPD